uniref:Uncharacterized protein n=1 Tax=Marseillevirus LCMAC102 TaxID=2506603 RepID=A0A481YU32_9VIRU|nr:MAG: hypothetical protein LCMAC102_00700 [Marseillevirus LCMAC102]
MSSQNGNESSVTVIENMQERLVEAALFAKEKIREKGIEDLRPAIEIKNESDCSIIIQNSVDEQNGEEYFFIYRNSSPLIGLPKNKYRRIYFCNLKNCRIFVKCKLAWVMFKNCVDCNISLKSGIIGMAEFFKCTNTNINIKIPAENNPPRFITRIEECKDFNIYQNNDALVYIVKLSVNVFGTITDPLTNERQSNYNLGKLVWNTQEQNLFCLSRVEGFAMVPIQYALNDLSHHIMTKTLEESDVVDGLSVDFGSTPPISLQKNEI